jgi:hypothetical protein
MMKECNKCKQVLPLDMFNKRQAKCKECRKQYDKQYHLNNPDYGKHAAKKWYKDHPNYYTQRTRQFRESLKLSYHLVYLLPDHNYVGITNNPIFRMYVHKSNYNRNTDNWIELARFDNRADALKCESEYHSQGYEGAKQLSTKTSCGA